MVCNTCSPELSLWNSHPVPTPVLGNSHCLDYLFFFLNNVCLCNCSMVTGEAPLLFFSLVNTAGISTSSSHIDLLFQWIVTTNIWPWMQINSEGSLLCISGDDRYLINRKECYILLPRWIPVCGVNECLLYCIFPIWD